MAVTLGRLAALRSSQGPWRLLAVSRSHGRVSLFSSTPCTPPAPPPRPPAGQTGSADAEAAKHSAAPKSEPVPKVEPTIQHKESTIELLAKPEVELPLHKPAREFFPAFLSILSGIISAAAGGVVIFLLQRTEPVNKRDAERLIDRDQPRVNDEEDLLAFSHHLPRTTVDPPLADGVYVTRATAERAMEVHLTGPPAAMLLLVGPKGSGKSTLVQHKLAGRPGAVAIDFTDKMHGTDMYSAIAKQVCPGRPALHERASDKTVLISLLKRATADYRKASGDGKWLPTIYVEVSRRVEVGTIKSVLAILKDLACDRKLCKVVVAMSDARTAFVFNNDPGRNDVMWFGDLTRAEAEEYLDRRKAFVGELAPLRDEVLGRVTRNAGLLRKVCGRLESEPGASAAEVVAAFASEQRANAESRVSGLLYSDGKPAPDGKLGVFQFARLLQDLLDHGGSVTAKQVSHYMLSEADVAKELESHQAIQLDVVSHVYSFTSPADEIAAKEALAKRHGIVRRFLNLFK